MVQSAAPQVPGRGTGPKRILIGAGILTLLALNVLISCKTAPAPSPWAPNRSADDSAGWVTIPGAKFVDEQTCADCHETEAQQIAATMHGKKKDPRSPAGQHLCQSCHGPGSVHVDNPQANEPGTLQIVSYKDGSPFPSRQKSAACLECHKGDRRDWHGTQHNFNGMSCSSCHSVHAAKGPKQLKKATEVETCSECHKDIKASLQRPSHHPIREGKVSCSDCHDAHGSGYEKNLKGSNVNDSCFQCHQDKRGPFLWQHPPVFENCLNCHTPHGSNNKALLLNNVPKQCEQCHSDSRHPGTMYDATTTFEGLTPSNRMFHNACLNCHSKIHGSNHPSGRTLLR